MEENNLKISLALNIRLEFSWMRHASDYILNKYIIADITHPTNSCLMSLTTDSISVFD